MKTQWRKRLILEEAGGLYLFWMIDHAPLNLLKKNVLSRQNEQKINAVFLVSSLREELP
jgi:hypothetical protein